MPHTPRLRLDGAKTFSICPLRPSIRVVVASPFHQPTLPPTSHQQTRKASSISASTIPSSATSTTKNPNKKVIFSGIQPTGVPHLGNYLGALKQWVHLQDTATATTTATTKLLFSVVDLHAITAPGSSGDDGGEDRQTRVGEALRQRRRETLAALLAIGLDPERSTIFYQSSCPAHSELMWILSCTASMGYLSRMTQWKSKLSLSRDTEALDDEAKTKLKLGLFSYPVLQAADIMVHGATHVPVGDDQKQHLEFTRECAKNFNHAYRTSVLIPPETILSPARRVMSLQNPTTKMSKSDPNTKARIEITDAPQTIHKKIASALTDTQSNHITYDPENRPGVANLLEILSILSHNTAGTSKTPAEIAAEGFGDEKVPLKALKLRTADAVVRELSDVRERYLDYLEVKGARWLDDVADKGAQKANANAEATMKRVKEAVGL